MSEPIICRPSDALHAALAVAFAHQLNEPVSRLDSVPVQQLVALRRLGWDVVRRPEPETT